MDYADLKAYLKTNINTALGTIWTTIGGIKYINLWDNEAHEGKSHIRFTLIEKGKPTTIFGNTGQVNNIAKEHINYLLTIDIFVKEGEEKQNSNHTDELIAALRKHYTMLQAPELFYRGFTKGNQYKSEDTRFNVYCCYVEFTNSVSYL